MSNEKSKSLSLIVRMAECYKGKHFEMIPAPVWANNPYEDPGKLLKSVGYALASDIGSTEVGMLIYSADFEATTLHQDKQILTNFPYVVVFEFANRIANKIVYVPSFSDLIDLIGIDVFTTGRPSVDRRRPSRSGIGDAEDQK